MSKRIACTICGDTEGKGERLETVIGPVCSVCFSAGAPESAPYWAERDRANGISTGPKRERSYRQSARKSAK